ncbi:MAG: DUF362 domain-containing protein [Myxococcota bacterium]
MATGPEQQRAEPTIIEPGEPDEPVASAKSAGTAGPSATDGTAARAEPTAGASDVVTHASPPWQPGPSVLATGSVDGNSLRKRTVERLSRDRSPVTVLRGGSPRQLGRRLCERVVPRVPPKRPVLLKPNIGGFAWFRNPNKHDGDNGLRGRTTDPEFVRGVIRCLKARGHRAITVAAGWSGERKYWDRLMDASGYGAMTAAEGVTMVGMHDDGVFDREGDKPGQPLAVTGMDKTSVPTLLMPKLLAEHLDHGLYISLPKIKAHRFSVVSLAIKGMQGTVMYSDAAPAYRQKWRSHRELSPYLKALKKGASDDRAAYIKALEVFATRMVDVLEVEAPHVVLAEGAPMMGGDGFNVLTPSAESVAIGGTNPVRVDRVGAQLLGLWDNAELARELGDHRTSPLIEVAAERFAIDLDSVAVIGDGTDLLARPRPVHFVAMAPFTISAPGSATPAHGLSRPLARARAVNPGAISIDGRIEEPDWALTTEVEWQTDYAGADTGITTVARFAWSSEALYAVFVMHDSNLSNSDPDRPIDVEHRTLYQKDCVELFLAPDPYRLDRYYEMEFGPHGHWFDLAIEVDGASKRKRRDLDWSSAAHIATAHDPTRKLSIIEVALKAPELTRALTADARLAMGLYRIEGKNPRVYLAWSPPRTAKPAFHVPEAFGTLVLEP